jgi:hypothetical protein
LIWFYPQKIAQKYFNFYDLGLISDLINFCKVEKRKKKGEGTRGNFLWGFVFFDFFEVFFVFLFFYRGLRQAPMAQVGFPVIT